jgi:hypothetical protein
MLGLAEVGRPVVHLGGNTARTTRALPSHPLQRLGEWLAPETMRPSLLRKLADGEVGFLLAGAWPAEGYTPYLRDCSPEAGAICLDSDLARNQGSC